MIEPSPAQRCMQHLGGPQLQPEYPAAAFNANRGGRVQVELELEFRAPDQPPRVEVFARQHMLAEVIEEWAPGYRRPELPNAVGEVGSVHPARQPLLDRLAQAELGLRRSQLEPA